MCHGQSQGARRAGHGAGEHGPALCCGTQSADSPAWGSRARAQPCTPTLGPALQPQPARVCCRGSGLVTANESKTLTPGKARVRSHGEPAENGKKHLFREGSVLISAWTVKVTNETFTILLYLFFLLLVLLQPQPSFGLLYLPNFDVCSFSKFTSASGHSARSFLLFFRI